MKNLTARLALAVAGLLAALPAALLAQTPAAFLKLASVEGESTFKADIDSFHWVRAWPPGAALNPYQPIFTGGVRVAVGSLEGGRGRSGLLVLSASASSKHEPYFKMILADTLVSGATERAGGHSAWLNLESVGQHIVRYRPLRGDGTRGEPLYGSWDREGRFFGDPAVFQAFKELGAVQWPDGTLSITGATR